jgi:hypothetical protein
LNNIERILTIDHVLFFSERIAREPIAAPPAGRWRARETEPALAFRDIKDVRAEKVAA